MSVGEIESVFEQPIAVVPDPAHSRAEQRFKAIGVIAEGRHVFVVFTLREHEGETFIRPISARYMHQKEVDYYEETAPRAQNR